MARGELTRRNRQPDSLVFHGELHGEATTVRIIGRSPRLTPEIDSFNAQFPVVVIDEIRHLTGKFTETGPETNTFRREIRIPGVPGGGADRERWVVKDVTKGMGSGEGTYYPYNVRVKGISEPEKYLFEYEDIRFELEEHEGWFYPKGGSKANQTASHDPNDPGKKQNIGTDSQGKPIRKLKAKDVPTEYKFIKQAGFAELAKRSTGNPYLAIISNCDNSGSGDTIEIDGVVWPKINAFDYEKDWKVNLGGDKVLVAVNDDYSERQKDAAENWIKDNQPGADGKHRISPDADDEISLQDGFFVLGGTRGKQKLTISWTIGEGLNLFMKIDNEWLHVRNDDKKCTEFEPNPGEEIQIPLKLEGIDSGKPGKVVAKIAHGTVGKKLESHPLNFEVKRTCRIAYLAGSSDMYTTEIKKRLDEIKSNYESIAPSGRFFVHHELLKGKDEANMYARNYYGAEKFPSFWRQIVLSTHGRAPSTGGMSANEKKFYNERINWSHDIGDQSGLGPWYWQAYWRGTADRPFESQNSSEFRDRFEGKDTSWYNDNESGHFGTYSSMGNELQARFGPNKIETEIEISRGKFFLPKALAKPADDLSFVLNCCYNRWAWRHPKDCPTNLKKALLKKDDDCREDSGFFDSVFKRDGNEYAPMKKGFHGGLLHGKLGFGEHTPNSRIFDYDYTIPVQIEGYMKLFEAKKQESDQ